MSLHLHAQSLQSCPTLFNPMDYRLPGSSSTEFSRQEYWSGLPCPPPRDLSNTGIEPASLVSPTLQEDSLLLSYWEAQEQSRCSIKHLINVCRIDAGCQQNLEVNNKVCSQFD